MNEARTEFIRRHKPAVTFDLKKRLVQLTRGECSADDFVRDSLTDGSHTTDTWDLLSFIDQRYRLGELPEELFQLVKSRIAWAELQDKEFGTTVELQPVPRKAAAAAVARLPSPAALPAPSSPVASDDLPPPSPIIAPALTVDDIQAVIGNHKPLAAPAPLQPGRELNGRYILEGILGSGGMGTVFKAVDRSGALPAQANRRVAIKILRERIERQPSILIQLRREFYCTQGLSHPNIVKVYELDQDAGLAFYTMELLSGESLHAAIARARPAGLPRPYAWALIRAVGSALAHAHARNVIHGDLKPQNVMITDAGEVRVLDFGSSRTSGDAQANPGDPATRLTASPPYASCDVLEGERPDERDDLYSLACLSHELLSGGHPFHGRSALLARDAGARAPRPAGLSHSQWHALQSALSCSRAERSIPVADWLEQIGIGIEPQRLPNIGAKPAPLSNQPRRLPWQDFALPLGAACMAVIIGASMHREPAATPVKESAPMQPAQALPAIPTTSAASPPIKPADRPRAQGPISTATRFPAYTPRPPTRKQVAAGLNPTVTLTAKTFLVRRNSNFAEVRVSRTDQATAFSWWTEDGSAQAGSDYAAQPRTTRTFSNDRRSATLFVRLTANARRGAPRTFYVQIAAAAAGERTGRITRAAVVVPASR